MGWLVVVALKPLLRTKPNQHHLLAGGVLYTLNHLYVWKAAYAHAIGMFCLSRSICHFFDFVYSTDLRKNLVVKDLFRLRLAFNESVCGM